MDAFNKLDAHSSAPASLRQFYKQLQKLPREALDSDLGVVDFERGLSAPQLSDIDAAGSIPASIISEGCKHVHDLNLIEARAVTVYSVKSVSGGRQLIFTYYQCF